MLALRNQRHQAGDVQRVVAQRPWRNLPVQHLHREVGMVGRDLAPALASVFGSDPHEAYKRVAKSFNALDFHALIVARNWTGPQVHFEQ